VPEEGDIGRELPRERGGGKRAARYNEGIAVLFHSDGNLLEILDGVNPLAVLACEGRLMVGSSTELNNEVPLANYLALRDAVLEGVR